MAIKKPQNNFTTPEQSKRLLELGLPANSSDCYFTESGKIEIKNTAFDILYTPCWSVYQLIEVYIIIRGCNAFEYTFTIGRNRIEDIVKMYEKTKDVLDFSKLEE